MTLRNVLAKRYAQEYAEQGWSVIPIRSNSKEPSKSWLEFQQRLMTQDEIDKTTWTNVAIVTGSISNLCVIDRDNDEGKSFCEKLPPTLTCRTSKGFHYYFRLPEGKRVPTRVRFLPGLDVRGEGGYVLAPPSVHPDGLMYEWVSGWHDAEDEPEIAVLPEEAYQAICSDAYSKLVAGGIKEGERNAAASSFVGSLLRRHWEEKNYEALWTEVKSWNKSLDPPLPMNELRSTFESIVKRDSHAKNAPPIERDLDSNFAGTVGELLDTPYVSIPHTIEGILTAGLAFLVGKPKIGKSRLAMKIAISVASGASLFSPLPLMVYGINGKVNHGRVLYLALEDSRDRLIKRFSWVVENAHEPLRSAVRRNIDVRTSWPSMYSGGVFELKKYLEANSDARLVIIDTAAAFMLGKKIEQGNAMQVEYALYKPLADLVMGKECTILVVAHARKDVATGGRAPDPIDMVSGTLGGPAQCDTVLTMYHPKAHKTVLDITGRDLEGAELPLKSNNLFWDIDKEEEEKE
jgi:hypothetical protein